MKRIIVCSDGTWNWPDKMEDGRPCPTNVVKMAHHIEPVDAEGNAQVVFYDQGVGTETPIRQITGGAFGTGLEQNVKDAYRFILMNYAPGDELWFFGFSRGAYTVRSAAGMVNNCSILRREHADLFHAAYELYRSPCAEHAPQGEHAVAFRETYSHPVPSVRFIGVWDTVGSRGIPFAPFAKWRQKRYGFHDTTLSWSVETARHALAIDERRRFFAPTLWTGPQGPEQTVEQVWFPGVHSDVGGGYPCSGLSDVALAWMHGQAAEAGLALRPLGALGCSPTAQLHESYKGAFRLMGAATRPMGWWNRPGQPATRESVHPSAHERVHSDPLYHPDNLARMGEPPSPPPDTPPPPRPPAPHCSSLPRGKCPLEIAHAIAASHCRPCRAAG